MNALPEELQAIRERDIHGPRPQDMLDDHIVECHVDRRDLLNLVAAQSDEVRRLREALNTYGRHLADCNYVVLGARPIVCTCGYQAALGSQP